LSKHKIIQILIVVLITCAITTSLVAQTGMSDVPTSHWAYDAVRFLIEANILGGMPDGTYQGNANTTRYQMAFALYRTIQYMQGGTPISIQPGISPGVVQEIEELRYLVQSVAITTERIGQQYEQINRRLDQMNLQGTPDISRLSGSVENLQQRVASLDRVLASVSAKQLQMESQQTAMRNEMESIQNKILTQNFDMQKLADSVHSIEEQDLISDIAIARRDIYALNLLNQSHSDQIQELKGMQGQLTLMTWVAVGGVLLGAAGLVVGIIAMQNQGQ